MTQFDGSLSPVSLSELDAITGGSDWWPTVACLLMPWREVVDGFSCEGVR